MSTKLILINVFKLSGNITEYICIPRSGIIFNAIIKRYIANGIIAPKMILFKPIVLYKFFHLSVSN